METRPSGSKFHLQPEFHKIPSGMDGRVIPVVTKMAAAGRQQSLELALASTFNDFSMKNEQTGLPG